VTLQTITGDITDSYWWRYRPLLVTLQTLPNYAAV